MPFEDTAFERLVSGESHVSVGLGRATRFAAHEGPQYSLFACYAFTINYILGVGSLGMPFAAKEAGYVAGLLLMIVVSLLSFITVLMVARATLRAEILELEPCLKKPIGNWCYVRCIATVGEPSLPNNESMCRACSKNCESPPRAFEVVQLCDEFLGNGGRLSYQIALVLLMYAGLLAYVLVFVKTLATMFELAREVSLLICSIVMISFSMLNLTEMVPLQVALSIINVLSLIMMGGIGLGTMIFDPSREVHELEPVNFNGLGLAFSTALFSQLFQHSVPGLITPLQREDRIRVPKVFGMALITTSLLYIFLSAACVLNFGEALEESVNVNFANFQWGARPPMIAKATSWFCTFYPALATVAVFPLIALTLSNSLLVVAPLPETWHSLHPRKVTVFFRLLAAVPPLAVALPLSSLSTAFKFAGLSGIWVAFVTPALLQLYSKRAMSARFDHLKRSSSDLNSLKKGYSVLSGAQRNPLFPSFRQDCWVVVVLVSAAAAFAVTLWGVVVDLIGTR